ncbi:MULTISPECIES: spore germination protein GerPB [Virgibacillus]|uniref:Spore gernimation protein KA n=1 Tax=Virgibacillus pantothenticus TaxID=1473 RepID=A0A0L0QTS1_VIRPA|nr:MULTISPECIES: spore germination protein GerPB [Virgibacillus]API91043.1 spore gernimation protein KA [Virgibacillus sp. 6R]KNE21999.1 spore gernimation protein KA [Virgibacillus pantothenticus]MBS7429032.1 spore gernimation protein KA [Virgibacillus sp. 19R1-5]MED3736108.1 spore germination protein GerPB [Virgibacillus pantothenticus]QTY17242.1 spore gernimation protein KA [Virgibacillus pantothenticus]
MPITVHQTISIYMIKVGAITNSSVLQIGTTGSVQSQSDIYNTGGYTEPVQTAELTGEAVPLVPLAP